MSARPIGKAPAWVRDYLPIPFVAGGRDRGGSDCYGLVRLVLAERFDATLPRYDGLAADSPEVAALAAQLEDLVPVPCDLKPFRSRGEERPGDLALLRWGGDPFHIGVVVAHRQLLHSYCGGGVCCADPEGPAYRWALSGLYRIPKGGPIRA